MIRQAVKLTFATSILLMLLQSSPAQALNKLPDIGGNAFSTLTPEKEKQLGDVMMRQTRGQLPMIYD
ncbi:MAG: hypothetical protein B7Z18_01060, partial [Alishewanella sp. 32-51-5]